MAHARPVARMTYAEYLAAEAVSETRHEFLNGEVFEMAGGTPEHGALAAAVIGELRNALGARPCRVFTSDARVRVLATGLSTYPDVSVVCGSLETAPDDQDAVINPVVLVEVLSAATEGYDRGAKAAHYRRIESLKAYVFVAQEPPLVEAYQRGTNGRWHLSEARPGQTLHLEALDIRLDVSAIYANPLGGRVA